MNNLSFVFPSILVALLLCQASAKDMPEILPEAVPSSVVNGYDAPNRQFYVELKLPQNYLCGGTIIGEKRVATAAHCVYDKNRKFHILIKDFSDRFSKETRIKVKSSFHPSYNPDTLENDVAILDLYESVPSWRVLRICTSDHYGKDYVYVAGMGRETIYGENFPSVLQETKLTETLNNCYFSRNVDFKKQVCVTGKENRGSCLGDSGGPLFIQKNGKPSCLYGIVSYVTTTCGVTGIFARASYYSNWLLQ